MHEALVSRRIDAVAKSLETVSSEIATLNEAVQRIQTATPVAGIRPLPGAEASKKAEARQFGSHERVSDEEVSDSSPSLPLVLPNYDRVRELAAWKDSTELRIRWLFKGEAVVLGNFGAPDRVYLVAGVPCEYWEYGIGAEEKRTLVFSRGRLVEVR
jgi:hypothetical protein